jgi:ERCC4-related helicase
MITNYHAKYYANELTSQHKLSSVDSISRSLFDASVDLNPHQIEASLFAMQSPLSKGVILADEVGLGKTIEAALVLCQYWAEKKRNLLVICPASLRKQWATELKEKFNLPTQVLDAVTYKKMQKDGVYAPLRQDCITIVSFHFPIKLEEQFLAIPWDLVVIDEAHKLRNAHRTSNKMGQAIKRIFDGRYKLLLTATPLQNSLMEIYGLSTLIDEHIFGDDKSFRKQFMGSDALLSELRERLDSFVNRTLRKDVLEYIKYTERKTITVPFKPTDLEHSLYEDISYFLSREDTFSLPNRQRHLITLIARKLLASSPYAIINTLETIKARLIKLRDNVEENFDDEDFLEALVEEDDLEADCLEAVFEDIDCETDTKPIERKIEKINEEVKTLEEFIARAYSIKNDTKVTSLMQALDQGFGHMANIQSRETGQAAPQKAIIFTESRRTQEYLAKYLSQNGYKDKIVTFSGSNNSPEATKIYQAWLKKNAGSDSVTGSSQVDRRTALIDYFRDEAEILIATEAAAEGVNLQFCALIINYDLPWNPQRIEQRIGRCHRYGQKFDVVVINFLNERNQADQRVLQLLTEKFKLFDGVFGASDNVLGSVENGVDFEKRIAEIYNTCRKPEEIDAAFKELQKDLEQNINEKMKKTQEALIENFDEDIHDILKIKLDQAVARLDKVGRYFWGLTKHILHEKAKFDDSKYAFTLNKTLSLDDVPAGKYQLVRKGSAETILNAHTYRLTHPLGEHVLAEGLEQETPPAQIEFDYSSHPTKISIIEALVGKSGWLTLKKLRMESLRAEEYLIFTGATDSGQILDAETCEKLFSCGTTSSPKSINDNTPQELLQNSKRQIDAKVSELVQENNIFFQAEREKLEKWADDKILGAEQALTDTKNRMRALKREARTASTIEEQQKIQTEIRDLEKLQRRQRQEIFDVEDEIIDKRDELIDALEQRLKQTTHVDELFTIRWNVA